MVKAYSYIRVSGKTQLRGDGPDRQRESVKDYAANNDCSIEQEFFDGGVSGSRDSFDRPALTELFASIRASGIKVILVERPDRVARDLMIGEMIYAECRKLGVRVIETEGGTELTVEDNEPTKVLIRQILGAVAQFEKAIIVQKLNAGRLRKRLAGGRAEGPPPFGHTPEEKLVVNRIHELKSTGLSPRRIADALNAEQKATRHGGLWHRTSVKRVLGRV